MQLKKLSLHGVAGYGLLVLAVDGHWLVLAVDGHGLVGGVVDLGTTLVVVVAVGKLVSCQ